MSGGTVHVRFFDAATGAMSGREFIGAAGDVATNTPSGMLPIQAHLVEDWQAQRVDPATGAVEDWQPPAPADDAWRTWHWNAETRRWTDRPTLAAHWRDVRAERDRRLAATDWVALRGLERGDPIPRAWKEYRQALRDIPNQGDPRTIAWPTPPAE